MKETTTINKTTTAAANGNSRESIQVTGRREHGLAEFSEDTGNILNHRNEEEI